VAQQRLGAVADTTFVSDFSASLGAGLESAMLGAGDAMREYSRFVRLSTLNRSRSKGPGSFSESLLFRY
jgi:hypothetical protein